MLSSDDEEEGRMEVSTTTEKKTEVDENRKDTNLEVVASNKSSIEHNNNSNYYDRGEISQKQEFTKLPIMNHRNEANNNHHEEEEEDYNNNNNSKDNQEYSKTMTPSAPDDDDGGIIFVDYGGSISDDDGGIIRDDDGNIIPEVSEEIFHDEEEPPAHQQRLQQQQQHEDIITAKQQQYQQPGKQKLSEKQKQEQSKKEEEAKEKNPDFQDVEETGKWGDLSKTEVISVFAIIILVVVGVFVSVIFLFLMEKEKDDVLLSDLSSESDMPSVSPTFRLDIPPEDQLEALLATLNNKTNIIGRQLDLVDDVNYYLHGSVSSSSATTLRAMSWILQDEWEAAPDDPWLIQRYALAVFFYSLEGERWKINFNWLSRNHVCEWYGITCLRTSQAMVEIDLHRNDLSGSLPKEIYLLKDLRSLLISFNHINGKVPFKPLGNMDSLTTLYLNSNNFTGQYNQVIAKNLVSTFFIQENNMLGKWPKTLCPKANEEPRLINWGLDCDPQVTQCTCCNEYNCY